MDITLVEEPTALLHELKNGFYPVLIYGCVSEVLVLFPIIFFLAFRDTENS